MFRRLLISIVFCMGVNAAYGHATEEGGASVTLSSLVKVLAKNNDIKIMYPEELRSITLHSSGINSSVVSYSELSTILNVHNYAIYKEGEIYVVKGKKYLRHSAISSYTEGEEYYPSQILSKIIYVQNACVATLLPLIRPLVPQHAHLAANATSNAVLITDIFENIQRIESIILDLDSHTKKQKDCSEKRASAAK